MKAPYAKPVITRIQLQDKELLAMALNCKDELPEVGNCCFLGNDPSCPEPGTGGPNFGQRAFSIGS
jgi:hypothetical protein